MKGEPGGTPCPKRYGTPHPQRRVVAERVAGNPDALRGISTLPTVLKSARPNQSARPNLSDCQPSAAARQGSPKSLGSPRRLGSQRAFAADRRKWPRSETVGVAAAWLETGRRGMFRAPAHPAKGAENGIPPEHRFGRSGRRRSAAFPFAARPPLRHPPIDRSSISGVQSRF